MTTYRAIKVYGERNTGTNYLDRLLALNVDLPRLRGVVPRALARMDRGLEASRDAYFRLSRRRNLGWKHQAAPSGAQIARWSTESVLFVTLTKDPYAWVLSMHRRPYHRSTPVGDLSTFIRAPWRTRWRDNVVDSQLSSVVELWNRKNASYLALGRSLPTVNLRYEDLLDDPAGVVDELVDRHGLPRLADGFQNAQASTKESAKDFAWYRSYYLERKFLEKLTSEQIAAISARLDRSVVEALDYEVL